MSVDSNHYQWQQYAHQCTDAHIVAIDNDWSRLTRVKENIERFQLKNITVKQGDAHDKAWWDGQLFDKILLDAPCSATGVIRRHPDIKLLRKPRDITQLSEIQASILDNLWGCLKPGGALLYAYNSAPPGFKQPQRLSRIDA